MTRPPRYLWSSDSDARPLHRATERYTAQAGIPPGEATDVIFARHVLAECADHLPAAEVSAIRSRWIEGVPVPAMATLHSAAWARAQEAEQRGDFGIEFVTSRMSAALLRDEPVDDDDVDLAWEAWASFIHDFRKLTGLPGGSRPHGSEAGLLPRHRWRLEPSSPEMKVWVETEIERYSLGVDDEIEASVSAVLSRLDGLEASLVTFARPGAEARLVVGGNAATGLVLYIASYETFFQLSDGSDGSMRRTVVAGGQPGQYEARFIVGLELAVRATVHFCLIGGLDPSLAFEGS